MKTTLFTLLIAATVTSASAVSIANWTFEGTAAPASVEANVSASNFTISSARVASIVSGGNAPSASSAINGSGWMAADGLRWWEFTVTANVGYALDLVSLTFDDRATGTGPTGWSVTVNGLTALSGQSTHAAFDATPMNFVNLSAASFQGVGSALVRIYGFGGSSSSGAWRLDNVTLNGAIAKSSSVPETLPFGFGAAVLLVVLGLGHRFGCFSPHTANGLIPVRRFAFALVRVD